MSDDPRADPTANVLAETCSQWQRVGSEAIKRFCEQKIIGELGSFEVPYPVGSRQIPVTLTIVSVSSFDTRWAMWNGEHYVISCGIRVRYRLPRGPQAVRPDERVLPARVLLNIRDDKPIFQHLKIA